MPLLETILLGKHYTIGTERVQALRGISLRLEAGEALAVVGPAGSGKTTLLHLLAGLDRPTRGTLYLDGIELTAARGHRLDEVRRQKVGYITPQPHLLPEQTVLGNVAWPLRYLPPQRRRILRERARRLLERVGLGERAAARPQSLTPAEQQRLAIARAFVNGPVLVLADEPARGLDGEDGRAVMALLVEMAREEGAALVVALAAPELAPAAARVLTLPEEGITPLAAPGRVPGGERLSAGEVLADVYGAELEPLTRPLAPFVNFFLRPALYTLAVAVLITYLCFFGLELAARGQAELPPEIWRNAGQAATQTVHYLGRALHGDLGAIRQYGYYFWAEPRETLVRDLVVDGVKRSLPLLGLAMLLAAAVGAPLGIGAALARRSRYSLGFIAVAVAGVSTPSFFLAFLLQLGEINLYRRTGIQLVPLGGFGWDRHMILPALVLAARPIAQVARISFVALAEVLDADYIRTARAKGLDDLDVLLRHALRNAAVPILNALGTSARFALSTLPVVETLFSWPGLGQKLLQAMSYHQMEMAAGMTLTLGLFFTVVNVLLENLNRLADPRLAVGRAGLAPRRSWTDVLQMGWQGLLDLPLKLQDTTQRWASYLSRLLGRLQRIPVPSLARVRPPTAGAAAVGALTSPGASGAATRERDTIAEARDAAIRGERRRAWVRHTMGSVPFMVGAIILLALMVVAVFGPAWAPHDPYTQTPVLTINGQRLTPPFPPSARFPLGTDQQGRDILSLLLVGARRTLTIACFAVLARVLLGTLLGCLAGWFAGSLVDRALMAAIEVLAAFPALLLAVVVIFALGVKQGMWVFIVGLCSVGWGEAAQFVRAQVMAIREKEYVEGALAVGLGDVQVLLHQALPNLFPSLVVLAFLEMAGVMMLLGELGFIGVFIGGGVSSTNILDQTFTYFDVPEWGVMLSNTWRTFRTHPWATFYPALAFTVTTVGFNFLGEGLRRLTERLTVNLNRLFNRYTVGAALAVAVLATVAAEGSGPWGRYKAMADGFDPARAMVDLRALTGPEMEGRRSGTPGLDRAADYIAGRFQAAGLQPAGAVEGTTYSYFETVNQDYHDLSGMPRLALKAWDGREVGPPVYGPDYVEYSGDYLQAGAAQGDVLYMAENTRQSIFGVPYPAWAEAAAGRVVLAEASSPTISRIPVKALLLIVPSAALAQRHLQPERVGTAQHMGVPYLYVSEETAQRILAVRGHSLEELRARRKTLGINEALTVETGVTADVEVPVAAQVGVPTRNVLAMFPGTDTELDDQAIFVVAHYDGLGRWPDGTLYPGANDNGSGVAVMLETARVLKESGFAPKRTLFFVAWAPAERRQEMDLTRMLSARLGFVEAYRITTVIELRGVGSGAGRGLVLDQSTSGRATDIIREAARREGVNVTTRGPTLHSSPIYVRYGSSSVPIPGRPRLPYLALSWNGSDATEHLATDTLASIDQQKLARSGRTLALALMRMAGESKY